MTPVRTLPLLLLAPVVSFAATTVETVDLFDESADGDADCIFEEEVSVVLDETFVVSGESWAVAGPFTVTAEGRHKACSIFIDELVVEIDGVELDSFPIRASGFGDPKADWHVSRTIDVPAFERKKLLDGTHTLTFRLTGLADSKDERIRMTVVGSLEHGRDWDDDGADDDELSAGTDCDDANSAINPDADEIWYDGIDQDCAGDNDYDQDKDEFLDPRGGGDDCDDTRADTYPGADEVWYDGIDQDCGDDSDYDQDGDGHDRFEDGGDDCDDLDAEKYPGARNWVAGDSGDCDFVVQDDGSRQPPGPVESTGSGCSRGQPVAAVVFLPLLMLGLRRRRDRRRGL